MAQPQGQRVYNFSAGPAVLPLPALLKAQSELLCFGEAGASIVEISHRSKPFDAVLQGAKANIRTLLAVPESYEILFLQGGASLQFSMAPMNLLRGTGKTADFIVTGSWGSKALKEAKKEGTCNVAFDGKAENYVRIPATTELKLTPGAAYVHFTSNETIQGVQFQTEPETNGVPLMCDASSDILSRPVAIEKYNLIYAGAQKNMGPSGVALVILRKDLLASIPENLPSMLDYKVMAESDSLYNTPPTFGIYMIKLVTDWLLETYGDLNTMQKVNRAKAQLLYDAIDASNGFYKGHAQKEFRSSMNVTWTLAAGADQEADFIKQAAAQGLASLKGHRSVGGIRASIYNAMPAEGVEKLRDFMVAYQQKNG